MSIVSPYANSEYINEIIVRMWMIWKCLMDHQIYTISNNYHVNDYWALWNRCKLVSSNIPGIRAHVCLIR